MKTKTNKIPLIIGIAIIIFSDIVTIFLSRTDMTTASLLEQYDHAIAEMFWNGLAP
jgi:hypothetical protein